MDKKLGIEIEFTGVTRREVVTALENLFQTVAEDVRSKTADDKYYYQRLKDKNGDFWLVVRDRSIKPQAYAYKVGEDRDDYRFEVLDLDDTDYMVELVSPALTSSSLPLLFTVIDVIKSLGGITNSSCGIHVHIDRPDRFEDIVTLFKRFCMEQDNIFSHFKVEPWRLEKYCKPYDKNLEVPDFHDLEQFMAYIWSHYRDVKKEFDTPVLLSRSTRYYGLNFYSLYQHGTIEFRLFNASLNKSDIAEILDWVLHFVYTVEDYSCYIPVLGGILMNEVRVED